MRLLFAGRECDSSAKILTRSQKIRRRLNLAVFFCFALYIALSPVFFYMAFEFFPEKYSRAKYEVADKLEHDDVFINVSNGAKIHGWYFDVPNSKHTIIIHHGQGFNVAMFFPAAELFHNCGASVLLYDYEGFGLSEGRTSHESLRRDSHAAYEFIRDVKNVPPNKIVHCGISLGTGAAADIAVREPCAGVFLCSPYWRLSELASNFVFPLRMYPRALFPRPDFGCAELVRKNIPIVVIHGDNDPIMPLAQAQRIYDEAIGPKKLFVVKNGFHVGGLAPGIEDFCTEWLDGLAGN